MPRLIFSLLLSLGFAGCSATQDGPGSSPLDSVEGFCQEWALRACNETVVERCSAMDADACIEQQASYCRGLIPSDKYSREFAGDCLDAVELAYEDGELDADERDVVREAAPPCSTIISGSGGEGDECTEDADCRSEGGLACVRKPGDATGTCQDPIVREAGFSCSGEREICEEGFYCDGANCLAAKEGGASCSADVPCAPDFNCEQQQPADGLPRLVPEDAVCVAKVDVGMECEKDADCRSDICSIGASMGVCSRIIPLSPTDPICEDLR